MNESDFEEGRIDFEMDSEMKWRGYRKQEGVDNFILSIIKSLDRSMCFLFYLENIVPKI